MRLIIDMNLSPRWVDSLAEANIDAQHWSSLGAANATDLEIMAFAAKNACIVLTNDLDFGKTLALSRAHFPSVFQIRSQDLSPTTIGPPVIAALLQAKSELMNGALVTFDPKRTRLTMLPLI